MSELGARGPLDVARCSLAELRVQLEGPAPAADCARLISALRADSRLGARALAESLARRARAQQLETRRLAGLFALRRRLCAEGARFVAGVDEVGVGPLAGPLVAAAVVLPADAELPGLDDSKRLTRSQRERLDTAIRAQAVAFAVAEVPTAEVDRINVLQASLLAMRRAVETLGIRPDHVLVDAHRIPGIEPPQTSIVSGDALDGSIAAASIVAKVHRDAIMRGLDALHPGYGFAKHKGYPTREHLLALERLGPTPIHRRSTAPVARCVRG
jgi:ribonuclease HII